MMSSNPRWRLITYTDWGLIDINMGVFLGKCFQTAGGKHMVCGQKKAGATCSARFDVKTAAKCCEFKRYKLGG